MRLDCSKEPPEDADLAVGFKNTIEQCSGGGELGFSAAAIGPNNNNRRWVFGYWRLVVGEDQRRRRARGSRWGRSGLGRFFWRVRPCREKSGRSLSIFLLCSGELTAMRNTFVGHHYRYHNSYILTYQTSTLSRPFRACYFLCALTQGVAWADIFCPFRLRAGAFSCTQTALSCIQLHSEHIQKAIHLHSAWYAEVHQLQALANR